MPVGLPSPRRRCESGGIPFLERARAVMKKVRDHYFEQAKREGFAARSAYKLEQIDRKQRLLRPGQRVLDLGCAPGSWLQYAAGRVGPKGRVLGVDLQPVTVPLPEQVRALQGDAFALPAAALLEDGRPSDAAPHGALFDAAAHGAHFDVAPRGALFDIVLSDMAPKTTGIPSADAARSADLALRALVLAEAVLKPGGDLLVKVFQGARLAEVRKAFAAAFERVSLEKPAASRSESVEIFLLARGLRPAAARTASSAHPPEAG
jgi:23S rRNA (uridine2552-2'-O)-methyltransferase